MSQIRNSYYESRRGILIETEGVKKPYSAPEFELVQFMLEDELLLTSYETPLIDVEEEYNDDIDSGAEGY